jgi:hypothetical protein
MIAVILICGEWPVNRVRLWESGIFVFVAKLCDATLYISGSLDVLVVKHAHGALVL